MEIAPIERKRACAVCWRDGKVLMVQIMDPSTGDKFWMPPGGQVEEGELSEQTAEREACEEAGEIVRVHENAKVTKTYPFCFDGVDYITTTDFYLCDWLKTDTDFEHPKDEFVQQAKWIELELALAYTSPWEPVQTAIYELVYPLTREHHGTENISLKD